MLKYAIIKNLTEVDNVVVSEQPISLPNWVDLAGRLCDIGWSYDGVNFNPPPPKSQAEIGAEKDVLATSALNKIDQKFLRDVLYLLDQRIRVLETRPAITKSQFVNGPGGLLDIYKGLL